MAEPTDEDCATRDALNALGFNGDLYMRLRGFYWIGPEGTKEPEFGYRDMTDSPLRQPIQGEAADLIKDQMLVVVKQQQLLEKAVSLVEEQKETLRDVTLQNVQLREKLNGEDDE
jgi:hypothetical protein